MTFGKRVWFTLVELIVVITIIAILSVIGFVSYNSYIGNSRDTSRIAQTVSLYNTISLQYVGKKLALPDWYLEVFDGNERIVYQWVVGKELMESIGYTNGWIDPKDGWYFVYSVSADRKRHQLLSYLENPYEDKDSGKIVLLWEEERYPYVYGDLVGILFDIPTNIPINESHSGTFDLGDSPDDYRVYLPWPRTEDGPWEEIAGIISTGGDWNLPAGSCYDPANVGQIGLAEWWECADMLIVDRAMLDSAVEISGGVDRQISAHGRDFTFWDSSDNIFTGQVTDMSELFKWSISDLNQFNSDIEYWNVSNVNNMREMFLYTINFDQPLNSWDVGNVTDMGYMFAGYHFNPNQFNQPLGNWDVSNVTNMDHMFAYTPNFNQAIGNWDVGNVTNMSYMFAGFSNDFHQFNQPLGNWDVSSVTNTSYMFYKAVNFNYPLGNWDVSNVIDMSGMLSGDYPLPNSFNQPLNTWDVSNVTNMSDLFSDSDFNQPLDTWDVSNVTNMDRLFHSSAFNQDISWWDVSNVETMIATFNSWVFNQTLNTWDVGNVTNMLYMFLGNRQFNQPLDNWDVSNVVEMTRMFEDTASFNQDISSWCVTNISSKPYYFDRYTPSWSKSWRQPVWGTCPSPSP